MIYRNILPSDKLSNYIKSFWVVDSEGDKTLKREKIIPDGYPEMIFHYGNTYRANISGEWFLQDKYLIAGQITNHFFLENTGVSGMIGIKFQPWAIKQLFNIEMHPLVNKVIPFPEALNDKLTALKKVVIANTQFEEKVANLENWFLGFAGNTPADESAFQKSVRLIIDSGGALSLKKITESNNLSERSLERYFKSYIGLSPKLYSRIIRFSKTFSIVQEKHFKWTEVSFLAGFYDQSHFIKNFKEFTGEEPGKYGFDTKNMANLFLKNNL